MGHLASHIFSVDMAEIGAYGAVIEIGVALMKVFVVVRYHYGATTVRAAFSTNELAEEFAAQNFMLYEIFELDVDEPD